MTSIDIEAVKSAWAGRWPDFYGTFTELKRQGGEWRGACPIHGGDDANFAVDADTGLYYCHSVCGTGGDAIQFLERTEGLAFPDALQRLADMAGIAAPVSLPRKPLVAKPKPPLGPVIAEYAYTDEDGQLLYQATRHEPKDFRQRRPDGNGGWTYNLDGVRLVPYRLPEVLAARTAYITEGEKDADALAALGLPATCNPMGAGKWRDEFSEAFCGKGVVILPDNDSPGRNHAQAIARSLHGKAKQLRVVDLPGLPDKGDASDWLEARRDEGLDDAAIKAALVELVRAAPDWEPTAEQFDGGDDCEISVKSVKSPPPDTLISLNTLFTQPWPVPNEAIYHGLLGDFVRLVGPQTEADPMALAGQFLAAFGNAIDRKAHFRAEADKHYGNLNVVLVGTSSKGRKGTSWGHVKRLFESAIPDWAGPCLASGLSSGEGLIHAVRDAIEKEVSDKETGGTRTEIVDGGVEDKRLLCQESEFASVLKVMGREGNTLSAIVRDFWDTGDVRTLTKNTPAKVTGGHVSIIGHITKDELKRTLDSTEAGNGFANRFLWLCVKRANVLPEGGSVDAGRLAKLAGRLEKAIEFASTVGEVKRDAEAREVWIAVYPALSEGGAGLVGSVTSRGEAQVMRLALLYALLDTSTTIRKEQLLAALAFWEYAEASAKFIFGDSTGDAVSDELLRALRGAENGMTRTEINQHFGKHQSQSRLTDVLATLQQAGKVYGRRETTGGRPSERWFATSKEGDGVA